MSSRMTVGLAYRIGVIVGPLRDARAVVRALIANFVLVPLRAVGIERVIHRWRSGSFCWRDRRERPF